MMRLVAAFALLAALVGCASSGPPASTGPAYSSAPRNYEASISSYFDLTGAPAQRKLAIGAPEKSPCVLLGGAGRHLGWMVPVVYDTTPNPNKPAAASTPTPSTKRASAKTKSHGKHVASTTEPSAPAVNSSGTVAMEEVYISGARYFFWFSNDTISGVSRRADACP